MFNQVKPLISTNTEIGLEANHIILFLQLSFDSCYIPIYLAMVYKDNFPGFVLLIAKSRAW